jgi:hypothetical protein
MNNTPKNPAIGERRHTRAPSCPITTHRRRDTKNTRFGTGLIRRYPLRSVGTVVVAALLLPGCLQMKRDQDTLDSYYKGRPSVPGATEVVSGEMRNFVLDVVSNRSTLENTVEGKLMRGVYIAGNDGCARVSVMHFETAPGDVMRPNTYKVCGTSVTRHEHQVSPSYPGDKDAQRALASAERNAVLYGSQRVRFQMYQIEARRLGVDSAAACRPVETVISLDGELVYQAVKNVCL